MVGKSRKNSGSLRAVKTPLLQLRAVLSAQPAHQKVFAFAPRHVAEQSPIEERMPRHRCSLLEATVTLRTIMHRDSGD